MMTILPARSSVEAQLALQRQEDELLASLDKDKLVVATVADLKPGLPLFYRLGNTYGCHILRNNAQLPQGYRKDTDFVGGVKARIFYILRDDSD